MVLDDRKVFVLEDDPERIKWFRHATRYANKVDIASEVNAAIKYLEEEDYDLIFLDHDLEPVHYKAYMEGYTAETMGTGYDLAQWMVANDAQRQALVLIHTLNPTGGDRMQAALAKWKPIRCPFTVLRMLAT